MFNLSDIKESTKYDEGNFYKTNNSGTSGTSGTLETKRPFSVQRKMEEEVCGRGRGHINWKVNWLKKLVTTLILGSTGIETI